MATWCAPPPSAAPSPPSPLSPPLPPLPTAPVPARPPLSYDRPQAVDQVTKNIARLLTLAGRPDVPFYRGCSEPLLSKPIDSSWFHGRDGLGDAPEVAPSYGQLRASMSPGLGPVRLVEAARLAADAGSPLHLVALGAFCRGDV